MTDFSVLLHFMASLVGREPEGSVRQQSPHSLSPALASQQEGALPKAHIWCAGLRGPIPAVPEFCVFCGSAGQAAAYKRGLVLNDLALHTSCAPPLWNVVMGDSVVRAPSAGLHAQGGLQLQRLETSLKAIKAKATFPAPGP